MNLQDLLRTETDLIEWTCSPQDSDGLFQAVCALANDLGASACPGYLAVGVETDGTVRGVDRAQLDRIQQDGLDQNPGHQVRCEVDGPHSGPYGSRPDRSGRADGITPVSPPTPPDMRFSASGG